MNKNNKKRKKTISKKKSNQIKISKNVLIPILICLILLVVVIIIVYSNTKNLVCSSINTYDVGIKQNNEVTFDYNWGNIKSINIVKTITVNEEFKTNEMPYLEIINDSLKSSYKTKNVKYSSKIKDNKLIVYLSYMDKKSYILDDVDIVLTSGGVNVNVMTEDNNNSRTTVDLSLKNPKSKVRKTLEDKKYKCN